MDGGQFWVDGGVWPFLWVSKSKWGFVEVYLG